MNIKSMIILTMSAHNDEDSINSIYYRPALPKAKQSDN